MSPEECIASLDSALAEAGEDVVLRRAIGSDPNTIYVMVKCRALVRTYRLREEVLVGEIAQGIDLVSISPSEIAAAQWPGGVMPGQAIDPSMPRRNDQIQIKDRWRMINAVSPLSVEGQIVRYEMQVLG